MLRSGVSCLYGSGNQVTFQGLHFEEKLSSQSRQGQCFPEHCLGNFQFQSKHSSVVCCSSNARFKSATLSQCRESDGRRWDDSEANTTSSLSGYEEEVELPFWERLKEAWRVLTGAPQVFQNTLFSVVIVSHRTWVTNARGWLLTIPSLLPLQINSTNAWSISVLQSWICSSFTFTRREACQCLFSFWFFQLFKNLVSSQASDSAFNGVGES